MRPSVLLVDDEQKVLNAWRRAFAQEPYLMLTARSGAEGMAILKGLKVAVVVSDYAMSNGNGLQLLEHVKTHYPTTTRIMVSGHATLSVAQSAINACGVMRFLQKPCSTVELGVAIRDALASTYRGGPVDDLSVARLELEREHPGITEIRRDQRGRIIIDS